MDLMRIAWQNKHNFIICELKKIYLLSDEKDMIQ